MTEKILNDLHRIRGSAFPEIIRHDKEIQPILAGKIATDPSNKNIVFSLGSEWHGVDILFRFIMNHDPRGM